MINSCLNEKCGAVLLEITETSKTSSDTFLANWSTFRALVVVLSLDVVIAVVVVVVVVAVVVVILA